MIYLSKREIIKIHAKGTNKSSKNAAPMMANKVMPYYTTIHEGVQ